MRLLLALVALLVAASPARAAWLEASSDHFLIYADTDEAWLRDFATRLERFDAGLRVTRAMPDDPGRRSNRLTIFVVDSVADVQKMCGKCPNVAGFYVARAGGSVAFTPRRSGFGSKWDLNAQAVLLHEYTHHILFQNFSAAYPAWFVEGFAEFNATAKFEEDGGVSFGAPPLYRAHGLMIGRTPLPAARLLGLSNGTLTGDQQEAIYGRGWLLTHYLVSDKDRRANLDAYLRALNSGTPALKAAQDAFGDLAQLDRALDRYKMGKFAGWKVLPAAIKLGPIAIRALSPGAAALMPVRMRSERGVNEKTAALVVTDARRRAAPFPTDPDAQVALAEAEYDAGQGDAALAAAERAIAADPKAVHAYLYKGRVLTDRAARAKADPAAWREARSWFLKANRIDPNRAQPLMLFYASFLAADAKPTGNAVDGLMRAFQLAPEDTSLRWMVARQYLVDGEAAAARVTLAPLAFNPHGGGDNPAALLVAALDAGKTGPAAIAELDARAGAAAARPAEPE